MRSRCWAVLSALLFVLPFVTAQAPNFRVTDQGRAVPSLEESALKTDDGMLRVIVQLVDPPLSSYRGGIPGLPATSRHETGDRFLNVRSEAATAYRNYLRAVQDDFLTVTRAAAPSLRATRQYDVIFNGVAMDVKPEELPAVVNAFGVKRVYPDTEVFQNMAASLPLINAPEFWEVLGGQGLAGDGIRIGIVDGGIRPENPFFDDTGYTAPQGYPIADSYCGQVDPTFCNNKIIVARGYQDTPSFPSEYPGPLGFNGHGTHVAGTAAGNMETFADGGNGVQLELSGVAPRAFIGVYKGLYWNGTTGSGFSSDLAQALNDAVADGMQVINNSWGGGAGGDPANSVYKPIMDEAAEAGIVMVVAAGNSGPGAVSVGCPGCIESVITVANTTHDRIFGYTMDVLGGAARDLTDLVVIEGTSALMTEDVGPLPLIYAGDVDPGNNEGCNAFPADVFAGGIAVIDRGSCSFNDKITNATAAGAQFVLVLNNQPTRPFSMGSLDGTTIPGVMASQVTGQMVLDYMAQNPGAQARINFGLQALNEPQFGDSMATSSSRGPNGDASFIKPDVGAPGSSILSAHSPDTIADFAFLSGTSMASPHVAGGAALLKQLRPDWSPSDIKTAIMSTSVLNNLRKEDFITPVDPFDIGAGRMDLERLTRAGITFDKGSFASEACFGGCEWTREIRNKTDVTQTFTAVLDGRDLNFNATVTPSEVTLAPGETANFTVAVDSRLLPQGGWAFGGVTWSASAAARGGQAVPDAYMPIAVFPIDTDDPAVVRKTADKTTSEQGGVITYEVQIDNLFFSEAVNVADILPETATYVADSLTATVDGAPDETATYDAETNTIAWSGELAAPTLTVGPGPSPFGYFSLAGLGVTPLGCSTVCDETSTTITGLDFNYLGQNYDSVAMSSNGFIAVGPDNGNAFTSTNTMLPDGTIPNGIIAPYWTDFDMDGTNPDDTGAGIWYFATLSLGPQSWHVFEWEAAQVWNTTLTATFQIWIEVGTDLIWFAYDTLPADMDQSLLSLTVGAENASGGVGDTYYFNGEGTLPAAGVDLQVTGGAGGSATLSYQVTANASVQGERPEPVTNVATIISGATSLRASASTSLECNPRDLYFQFLPEFGETTNVLDLLAQLCR